MAVKMMREEREREACSAGAAAACAAEVKRVGKSRLSLAKTKPRQLRGGGKRREGMTRTFSDFGKLPNPGRGAGRDRLRSTRRSQLDIPVIDKASQRSRQAATSSRVKRGDGTDLAMNRTRRSQRGDLPQERVKTAAQARKEKFIEALWSDPSSSTSPQSRFSPRSPKWENESLFSEKSVDSLVLARLPPRIFEDALGITSLPSSGQSHHAELDAQSTMAIYDNKREEQPHGLDWMTSSHLSHGGADRFAVQVDEINEFIENREAVEALDKVVSFQHKARSQLSERKHRLEEELRLIREARATLVSETAQEQVTVDRVYKIKLREFYRKMNSSEIVYSRIAYREAAAVTIQAAWRGAMASDFVNACRRSMGLPARRRFCSPHRASGSLQQIQDILGKIDSHELGSMPRSLQEEVKTALSKHVQEKAAEKLQGVFRGHVSRTKATKAAEIARYKREWDDFMGGSEPRAKSGDGQDEANASSSSESNNDNNDHNMDNAAELTSTHFEDNEAPGEDQDEQVGTGGAWEQELEQQLEQDVAYEEAWASHGDTDLPVADQQEISVVNHDQHPSQEQDAVLENVPEEEAGEGTHQADQLQHKWYAQVEEGTIPSVAGRVPAPIETEFAESDLGSQGPLLWSPTSPKSPKSVAEIQTAVLALQAVGFRCISEVENVVPLLGTAVKMVRSDGSTDDVTLLEVVKNKVRCQCLDGKIVLKRFKYCYVIPPELLNLAVDDGNTSSCKLEAGTSPDQAFPSVGSEQPVKDEMQSVVEETKDEEKVATSLVSEASSLNDKSPGGDQDPPVENEPSLDEDREDGDEDHDDGDEDHEDGDEDMADNVKERIGDWEVCFDDDGKEFFFNVKSEESFWGVPEEVQRFRDNATGEANVAGEEALLLPGQSESRISESSGELSSNNNVRKRIGDWEVCEDEEGNEFYYNVVSKESFWGLPEELEGQQEQVSWEEREDEDGDARPSTRPKRLGKQHFDHPSE
ncbi:Pre-mRNA-processing protein prp40 [Durusdinium trenchii]|uniref:Pre-mRNA-processing protein prp40 n=1 Tax=Durusdinium trenchii TaxID=1381693 RepID=A0ABP0HK70_9DINO